MGMMKLKAYAKINLLLNVVRKRADGYHSLRTVYQEIDLHDEILIETNSRDIHLRCQGYTVPAGPANLVWRAAYILRKAGGRRAIGRGVSIDLYKHIPPGTGLGSGSSDAAAVLKGLNRLWKLHFSAPRLHAVGKQLGSDVCFFLQGGTMLGSGRGEQLGRLPNLPHTWLVVAWPGFPSATATAYKELRHETLKPDRRVGQFCVSLRQKRFQELPLYLHNDLEEPVFRRYPRIRKLKESMIQADVGAVLMSGSGSSVYAMVQNRRAAMKLAQSIKPLAKKVWITCTRSNVSKC